MESFLKIIILQVVTRNKYSIYMTISLLYNNCLFTKTAIIFFVLSVITLKLELDIKQFIQVCQSFFRCDDLALLFMKFITVKRFVQISTMIIGNAKTKSVIELLLMLLPALVTYYNDVCKRSLRSLETKCWRWMTQYTVSSSGTLISSKLWNPYNTLS